MPTDKLQILTPIVTSVNGNTGDVTVATKTSELENDSGFATTAYVDTEVSGAKEQANQAVVNLSSVVSTNYDESIIGLSVDGTTVTYIKGDGSVHTFETQDTDTTYSLGTDTVTGLTKLYATTGSAEDGTMTQKAIKTELDKKVGVEINSTTNTLIFTK